MVAPSVVVRFANRGLGYELGTRKRSSPTSNRTAKRLARLGALSRSTKRMVGDSFTRHTQFAFGHGGDQPGYVSKKRNPICPVRQSPDGEFTDSNCYFPSALATAGASASPRRSVAGSA